MAVAPRVTGAAITLALRASGGVIRRAAEALGVHSTTIRDRLRTRPSLWPEEVPHRQRGGQEPAIPDEIVTDALWTARGDVVEAARALGTDRDTLRARLRRQPALMPAELRR